jgi:hypothetical protein
MDLGNEPRSQLVSLGRKRHDPDAHGKSVPWDGDDAQVTRLVAFDITTGKTRFIAAGGRAGRR